MIYYINVTIITLNVRELSIFRKLIVEEIEEHYHLEKLMLFTTGGTVASLEGENGLVPELQADELLSGFGINNKRIKKVAIYN